MMEKRGKGIFLRASPVDVSELLREKLFDKVETCILTSATLSSNGKFDFIRDRLGLDTAKTSGFEAPTAFNYEKQAILYLPRAMPDPRSPEFTQLAAGEIIKILQRRGRAFVLCTSFQSMNALYELVRHASVIMFRPGNDVKGRHARPVRETPTPSFSLHPAFGRASRSGEQLSCV